MKKSLRNITLVCLMLLLVTGVAYSVFSTQGRIAGTQFTTGHADLALLRDLSQGPSSSNLTKALPGSFFEGLMHNSQRQLALKLTNIGTLGLETILEAQSFDIPTTPDLRNAIRVTLFRWFDDGDGVVDESELSSGLETKTLTQWLSMPFVLGSLAPTTVMGYVLQFTVSDLDNTYQGLSTTVDFIFNAAAHNQ